MKTSKIYFTAVMALVLIAAVGCGETTDDLTSTDPEREMDRDGGGTDVDPDKSGCADPGTFTCAAMIEAGKPDACIADFSFSTNQVGKNIGDSFEADDTIGFYGYNDKTDGATMKPVPNNEGTEPAAEIESCDPRNNYALHLQLVGFNDWGAGIGMDWGGPENENCDESLHPGVSECLEISLTDNKFVLERVKENPVCKGSSPQETEAFIHCLKFGRIIKNMRDLTAYKGIGFWILQTEDNRASNVKVTFPIPETARFLTELHDNGIEGCDEHVSGKECFNDFATTIGLKPEKNKWQYFEVLFEDIEIASNWGYSTLANSYSAFPANRSIGIKFQVDTPKGSDIAYTDLYIDDVVLLSY